MNGFLMLSEETAYNEATTTLARTFEFNSESLAFNPNIIESNAIRDGARYDRTARWAQGTSNVGGKVTMELNTRGMGIWLKHMLGAIATSGTGPFTHTATPGSLVGKSLRIQVARADRGAVKRPFTYTGCKVNGWSMNAKVDEYCMLEVDLLGAAERTADALGTPDYTAVGIPVLFTAATLTVGGTAVPVREITLEGKNGFDDKSRYVIGTTAGTEPNEYDKREITASCDADWTSLTEYNRFKSATEASLSLVFAGVLTVTLTVRTDGDTPTIGGWEEVRQPLKFKALADATGAAGISFAYSSTDATP